MPLGERPRRLQPPFLELQRGGDGCAEEAAQTCLSPVASDEQAVDVLGASCSLAHLPGFAHLIERREGQRQRIGQV